MNIMIQVKNQDEYTKLIQVLDTLGLSYEPQAIQKDSPSNQDSKHSARLMLNQLLNRLKDSD